MTTMGELVGEVRRLTYGTLTEQLNLIQSDYTPFRLRSSGYGHEPDQPGMLLSRIERLVRPYGQ